MKAETGMAILGVLKAAYPAREHDPGTAAAYLALLADLDDEAVERAVLALCRTQTFMPSVSEIITRAMDEKDPVPSAAEAWESILGAIRRGEHRKPVAERTYPVHPFALEVLAGVGGLRAVAETEQIDTTRAHFFHRFEEGKEKRRRDVADLGAPKSLRELHSRMREMMPAGAVLGPARRSGILADLSAPRTHTDGRPPGKGQ